MPYNDITSRTDIAPLIPEEVSAEILTDLNATSPLLQLARKLPNMSRAQVRMPVRNSIAHAYFVSGDTGLKQTASMLWANKYIYAEELAVIVPIGQNVLDDVDYDIWGETKPALVAAFSAAMTAAVLYGTNIPANWSTSLGGAGIAIPTTSGGAAPATHVIQAAAYADWYEAILGRVPGGGAKGSFMLVEEDGFGVNGNLADISMKGELRNTRDMNGQPIFKTSMQDATRYELDGTPIYFPMDGSVDPTYSLLVSGDWSQLVYSMRQDMTYTIAKEAVITDNAGNIIYNLFQQDMVALRAVMRIGFALPNPKNRVNETDATRYPFTVLIA